MQLYCNWIATEHNPADQPSRVFEFDSTLGYPGEGPRTPGLARKAHLRIPRNLAETEVSAQTRRDRDAAVQRLETYLEHEGYDPVEDLRHFPDEINAAAALFIQHLYDKCSPLSYGVDCLLGS